MAFAGKMPGKAPISVGTALEFFFLQEVKRDATTGPQFLTYYDIPKMPAQTEDTEQHQFRQKRKKSVESAPVPVKKAKATDVCKTASTCMTREERLFVFLSSELSKACCLFLNNIIPAFETVNFRLQAQAPLIHKLQPILLDLLEDILSRFEASTAKAAQGHLFDRLPQQKCTKG